MLTLQVETRAINLNSQETISINVDANPLGNMKILLNKLVGYFPRKLGLRSNGVFYALNPFTLTRLLTLLDNRVLLETVEYISGTELIVAIEEVGDFTIDILPANEFVGQNMVEGGLFPYTHNLDKVDLTRYAIFHKNTNQGEEINDNNCLITALKCKGIDTEPLRQYVKNQYIPQKYLTEIALKIKHYIIIKQVGSKNLRKYGDPIDPQVLIGLVASHYFLIEDTEYTSYSIENYFTINHLKNWNKIKQHVIKKDKKYYTRTDNNFVDTYTLINLLVENKATHLLKLEGIEIYKMNNHKKHEEDIFKSLEYCDLVHSRVYDEEKGKVIEINKEGDLEENKPKSKNKNRKVIGMDFFDFETSTRREDGIIVKNHHEDDNGNTVIHKPYLLGSSHFDCIFYGEDCGKKYLDALCSEYGTMINKEEKVSDKSNPVFIIIAHNAGYDFRFLLSYFSKVETIEKGTGLMMARCEYFYTKYISKGKSFTRLLRLEIV